MDFSLHTTFPDPSFAPEWNALLSESITDAPFLRYEYLSQWWQTRGGGEWPEAELFLLVAREGGRLLGIAPLFRANNRDAKPALFLLGSIEISDQLDLIVRSADLPRFIAALLDYLAAGPASGVALDWVNLPDTSPTLAALRAESAARGLSYQQEVYQPAPFISLSGTYDDYLARLDKKQRHEVRRKVRRAEESGRGVRWYIIDREDQLPQAMESFLDLMANDPAKAGFLTPLMRQQMHAAALASFRAGWLQLAFLEVEGDPACAYLNFDYGGRIWVYNSGLDRRFMDLSPGWVLLAYLLEWACQHGRSEFDFLRGGEDYKYKFGGQDRFVLRVLVSPA